MSTGFQHDQPTPAPLLKKLDQHLIVRGAVAYKSGGGENGVRSAMRDACSEEAASLGLDYPANWWDERIELLVPKAIALAGTSDDPETYVLGG